MPASLKRYRAKRNFERTPEPRGGTPRGASRARRFVIQMHDASRLHYDFRLEAGGALKSWAVPKGPSLNPADKRLAMHVEDHPLAYRTFEGVIPKGNYGAGEVIVWDAGTYRTINGSDPTRDIAAGKITFLLNGKKLHGEFALVKMRGRGSNDNAWLLLKANDEFANRRWSASAHPESVKTGRTLKDIARAPRARKWRSNRAS